MIKKGDIIYTLDIDRHLVATISKIFIKDHELRDGKEFIYWNNLENITIRDCEIPLKEDDDRKLAGNTISGCGYINDYSFDMFSREYVTKAIFKKNGELSSLKMIQYIRDSKFVCPLTGNKLIKQKDHNRFVLGDYGQAYNVENSTLVWKTMDRVNPYGLMHANSKSELYSVDYYFLFNEEELTWKQYLKIGNREFCPYPENVIDSILISYKKFKFWLKGFIKNIKNFYPKKSNFTNLGINIKPMYSAISGFDLIEVKPMSAPNNPIIYFNDIEHDKTKPINREISLKDL